MWWLFSNKRTKEDYSVIHNFHFLNKVKTMEENLKNSFFNIKKDISKVNSLLYHHDNNLNHLKERVTYLETLLKDLHYKDAKRTKEIPKNIEITEKEPVSLPTSVNISTVKWEDLTNIQQNMLLRLGLLQMESSQRRIAMKHLAEELYPEKTYNDVRSMISDYVNLLNEHGLIKKTRKGRQIFVSITERGSLFYDKEKRKKLLDIIKKHKE